MGIQFRVIQYSYYPGAMTFSVMTFSIMTLSITTLSIMILSIMRLSIAINKKRHSA